jgi:hypothetical protein
MATFDPKLRLVPALLPPLCMCNGMYIQSMDQRFQLIFQSDGNLVLYMNQSQVLWASGTYGSGACCLIMQPDGNLVMYDMNWQSGWNTQTYGNNGSWLVVQNDGNAVMYENGQSSPNGASVWATNTSGH